MEKSFCSGGPFWPYSQGSGEGGTYMPKFQNMLDPLDSDLFGPVVVKAEVRNILQCIVVCTAIYGL